MQWHQLRGTETAEEKPEAVLNYLTMTDYVTFAPENWKMYLQKDVFLYFFGPSVAELWQFSLFQPGLQPQGRMAWHDESWPFWLHSKVWMMFLVWMVFLPCVTGAKMRNIKWWSVEFDGTGEINRIKMSNAGGVTRSRRWFDVFCSTWRKCMQLEHFNWFLEGESMSFINVLYSLMRWHQMTSETFGILFKQYHQKQLLMRSWRPCYYPLCILHPLLLVLQKGQVHNPRLLYHLHTGQFHLL